MIKHNKESQNKMRKDWIFLLSIGLLAVVVLYFIPTKADKIIQTSLEYLKQMTLIFPAVLILMGLFSVWISQDFVISHLGDRSGLKGIMISFLLGALPTGPVYVAFPLAQALRQKGASYTNIVIFLSAWACIKLPQELVELQFMGAKFMLARLSLSIIFITLMGLTIDKLLKTEKK